MTRSGTCSRHHSSAFSGLSKSTGVHSPSLSTSALIRVRLISLSSTIKTVFMNSRIAGWGERHSGTTRSPGWRNAVGGEYIMPRHETTLRPLPRHPLLHRLQVFRKEPGTGGKLGWLPTRFGDNRRQTGPDP